MQILSASSLLKTFQCVALLTILCCPVPCSAWRKGRATFYGDEPWYWTIHHGSCGKGYLWPDEGTGWDVAALSDAHYEYKGSCGRCYEVSCDGTSFRDGYGAHINRNSVCHDGAASVVVRTVDTCQCSYGNNYYSNKRWCCGDMDHLDLSVHTFEKLADKKWGVIGIKYRPVSCDHQPHRSPGRPSNPTPGVLPPPWVKPKPGFDWNRWFPGGRGFPWPGQTSKNHEVMSLQQYKDTTGYQWTG